MAQLQIVYLLRSGTQEQWRRLSQEIAQSRREEFEASCQRMGITQVQVRLVHLLHGDLMLMTLHTREPQQTLTATVDGRSVGMGKTIRIESIAVHYDLAVPPDSRAAAERALHLHPEGCPAHQSVKAAIRITWDATLHVGEEVIRLNSEASLAEDVTL